MHKNVLRILFVLELIVFGLVIFGIVPRTVALYLTAAMVAFVIWAPVEDGLVFFIQSIPLFLALPLTNSFDNFNAWRIILLALFSHWLVARGILSRLTINLRQHQYIIGLSSLIVLAALSLIGAPDLAAGVKRIIYFANIAMVGIILYDLVRQNKDFGHRIIQALRVPAVIVITVGFLQVISTYLIDIYQFMRLWGEGIQCNQFGEQWCYIAVHLGNTWLAYFGEQLSLRVFSLFPDSHSFPQFVLLTIPALLTYGISNIISSPERLDRFKTLAKTRGKLGILWVPAAFLMAILSGTRGIWAASVGVVIIFIVVNYLLIRWRASTAHKNLFRFTSSFVIIFFMLFSVAYPIFTSPQFLLSKGDFGLFRNRIRSIIDFGETSNSQRIEIWRKSIDSIKQHPFLGVGIGNFPVVLGEDIFLAKAGSSAHNVYLQIAAEMGIPALLISIWLLVMFFKQLLRGYINEHDPKYMAFIAASFLFVPWVLIYSLTDVALFDERAFLMFVAVVTLLAAVTSHNSAENE